MLYKDSENGIVMGVCAGLANCLDLRTRGVRIVAFICLLFFTIPTLLLYALAGYLLRDRPLHFDKFSERRFWKKARSGATSERRTYSHTYSRRS